MSTVRKNPILRIAPPYDDALLRRIEKGFADMLGFGVQFDVREDPSLLSLPTFAARFTMRAEKRSFQA